MHDTFALGLVKRRPVRGTFYCNLIWRSCTRHQDRAIAAGEGFRSDGCRRTGQDARALWERSSVGRAGHLAGGHGAVAVVSDGGGEIGARVGDGAEGGTWLAARLVEPQDAAGDRPRIGYVGFAMTSDGQYSCPLWREDF